jgi:hypothetical protein
MRRRAAVEVGLVCLLLGGVASAEAEPPRSVPAGRTLIILLDAVPYTAMARLAWAGEASGGEEGLFRGFEPPRPLISTFPSSTSAALPGILGDRGLERSPGYEARFFDWERRQRRGGGVLSYFGITFPWREFFDWNRKGPVRNALHAAHPVRSGRREIRSALAAFEASGLETFTIYVADTDTAAHLRGPTGPDAILRELDAALRGVFARHGPGLRVVLLSDHGLAGGDRLRNVLPGVRQAVAEGGWRLAERLTDEHDVVLTPYGLVSSFEAYTAPSQAAAVSATLAGVAGVDLCAVPAAPGWRADAATYAVAFERRQGAAGTEWRWQARGTAEAGLAGVLGEVAAAGRWVPGSELLKATGLAEYPDPLYRLATAFEVVENPASVICSVSDGFMYGARATERTARWTKGALRWTHGSLGRDASLGFLMTNFSTLQSADSASQALRYDAALRLTFPARVPTPARGTVP